MILEQGTITVGLVGIVAAVAGAAVAITLWVSSRIAAAEERAAVARAAIADDMRKLRETFSDYKLSVAETYMSKQSGGMAIDRAVAEIKGLRSDLKEEVTALRTDWRAEMAKFGDRLERMESHALRGG